MRSLVWTWSGLVFFVLSICSPLSASAQSSNSPKIQGCPLEIAVQQADKFVQERILELSRASVPLLDEMRTINEKATKPGVPVGQQLSPQDVNRFNEVRNANVLLGAEKLKFAAFRRDVHLIAATYDVVKLAGLYELKKEELGDASPLRFYFTILETLRIAQPRVSVTPLINVGIDCDPEAGLFWEEKLYQQQLAKSGADQRLVNLIFDIERLRTLYQLSWNLLNKGVDDIRRTKWVGDNPNSPNTIAPWVVTSSAALQNMYKVVIPYIDKHLPSEAAVEASFMQKVVQNAERDYPATKK